MRGIELALVLCSMFLTAGMSIAQMDQSQMDQSQANQQTMNQNQANQAQTDQGQMQAAQATTDRATIQRGPVVQPGWPASTDVYVDGRFAMRIAAPAGGMSTTQRAQIIADRLNQAFAEGASWSDMRVSQVGNNWTVNLGDRVIATADSLSACGLGLTQGQLASAWARQTVVALGGQPTTIASQLQPVPSRVAGARQQVGAQPCAPVAPPAWSTATTKSVLLISADTGNTLGTVTVAGPQSQLNMVNAVAVYQSTAPSGATIYTFVPITTTTVTGQVTRVPSVGLVSLPITMLPTSGFATGNDALNTMNQNSAQWNSQINSSLAKNNIQLRANTKIVPLYSMDTNQVVGAAQVVGNASAVNNTQAVVATTSGDMLRLNATSSACAVPMTGQPAPMNNVVVSSIIMAPAPAAVVTPAPETTTPGMTQPAPSTAPGTGTTPAPGTGTGTMPESSTPPAGTTAPETTPPTPPATP